LTLESLQSVSSRIGHHSIHWKIGVHEPVQQTLKQHDDVAGLDG
jgi:hypothetical protein